MQSLAMPKCTSLILATPLEWLLELNVNPSQFFLPVKMEKIDFAYEHLYMHRNADSAFQGDVAQPFK